MPKIREVNLSLPEYRIFETDRFANDLKQISSSLQETIEKKLKKYVYPQLYKQPYFGSHIKKLKGWKLETWRYKIGSWRFFYEINGKEKTIL